MIRKGKLVQYRNAQAIRENQVICANLRIDSRESGPLSQGVFRVFQGIFRMFFLCPSGYPLLHPSNKGHLQGDSGTEPEPRTGTVGTVFPETGSGTGTAGTVNFPGAETGTGTVLSC